MRIALDLDNFPAASLREPDDFTRFEIALPAATHAFVSPADLERLAGARADDPDWQHNLEEMLTYAEKTGWRQEDGAIRVHISRGP